MHTHSAGVTWVDSVSDSALLTPQICNLWNHLSRFKRDIPNRRSVCRLVHQRAKLPQILEAHESRMS
ncbi:hypothetical protein BGW80DRAFT_1347468 [Lactifluus volemus]|nr:hypothetical protein BGW80DRAFT_1347468 [Lactifluus volemus]